MLSRFKVIVLIGLLLQVASSVPCRAAGQAGAMSTDVAKYCIYHPDPAWWAQARRGMHGKVTCQMIIDPKNGEVTEVKVLRRSAFQELDAACVLTCFKWKFMPNTIKIATTSFELVLSGYFKEIH
jgi:TonB family protein